MKKQSSLLLCAIVLASCAMLLSVVQAVSTGCCHLSFVSCDADGNKKSVFQIDDDVYIKGGYFIRNREVTIYVISTGKPPKPEYKATNPTTETIVDHSLPVTLIWSASLTPGKYDVWIDVNQNGKFDFGDRLHYILRCYQFHVIPEYIIGSIGALIAMLASLAIFHRRKSINFPKTP